jgi:hypothetical protein
VANIAVVKQEKAEKLEMILIQVTSIEIYNWIIECIEREHLRQSDRVAVDWFTGTSEWERVVRSTNYQSNDDSILRWLYSSKEKDLMMMII